MGWSVDAIAIATGSHESTPLRHVSGALVQVGREADLMNQFKAILKTKGLGET